MHEYHAGVDNLFLSDFPDRKDGATIPVTMNNLFSADAYINPVPHALMLTAIVVSLGITGVGLALLMRIKDIYGTIEEKRYNRKGR